MEKEVIAFFQKILKDRMKNNKNTRCAQLAGYLANNETIRKWFLKYYPTECDYINFFHQYYRYFNYDNETGYITINDKPTFKKSGKFDEIITFPNGEKIESLKICEDKCWTLQCLHFTFDCLVKNLRFMKNGKCEPSSEHQAGQSLPLATLLSDFDESILNYISNMKDATKASSSNRRWERTCYESLTENLISFYQMFPRLFCVDIAAETVSVNPEIVHIIDETMQELNKRLRNACRDLMMSYIREEGAKNWRKEVADVRRYLCHHHRQAFFLVIGKEEEAEKADSNLIAFVNSYANELLVEYDAKSGYFLEIVQQKTVDTPLKTLGFQMQNIFGDYLHSIQGIVCNPKKKSALVKVSFNDDRLDFRDTFFVIDVGFTLVIDQKVSDLRTCLRRADKIIFDAVFRKDTEKLWFVKKIHVIDHGFLPFESYSLKLSQNGDTSSDMTNNDKAKFKKKNKRATVEFLTPIVEELDVKQINEDASI